MLHPLPLWVARGDSGETGEGASAREPPASSSWIRPLIRRHSRSFASALLRTAAKAAFVTFAHNGRRKGALSYLAFFAFALAFFAGFSLTGFSFGAAFFSAFSATGVLATSRIERA